MSRKILGGAMLALTITATTALTALPHIAAPAAASSVCADDDLPVYGFKHFEDKFPKNAVGAMFALNDQFDKVQRAVFCLTNVERANAGVPALKWSDDLSGSAAVFARHAEGRQWWTDGANFHDDPDLAGVPVNTQVQQRVQSNNPCTYYKGDGHEVNRWSENLYAGWDAESFTTAKAAVAWWMNSPTHRANILDRNVTKLGVGVRSGAARPGIDPAKPAGTFVQQFAGCS
ncbi:CAP domain-containing protein [Nocardia sp. NPDC056000]|uniref:CAP domain-containing protein n=1 Tax=Nocardia sp. NPDC056000 TaxID=3345674 RepID=UPI0035DE6199